MHVIISNYGDDSVALLQFIFAARLADVYVLYVHTGWAAECWHERVAHGQQYAHNCGFKVVHLQPRLQFSELVSDRGDFPSQKFQWCAGILKGLPILEWLDDNDPGCEALIMLGKRREAARSMANTPEYIEESEHFGERRVWHPLITMGLDERNRLIADAGFEVLGHRSLECDPCVNSNAADFERLADSEITKTKGLEEKLGKTMFSDPNRGVQQCICEVIKSTKKIGKTSCNSDYSNFGCGSPYGCGI